MRATWRLPPSARTDGQGDSAIEDDDRDGAPVRSPGEAIGALHARWPEIAKDQLVSESELAGLSSVLGGYSKGPEAASSLDDLYDRFVTFVRGDLNAAVNRDRNWYSSAALFVTRRDKTAPAPRFEEWIEKFASLQPRLDDYEQVQSVGVLKRHVASHRASVASMVVEASRYTDPKPIHAAAVLMLMCVESPEDAKLAHWYIAHAKGKGRLGSDDDLRCFEEAVSRGAPISSLSYFIATAPGLWGTCWKSLVKERSLEPQDVSLLVEIAGSGKANWDPVHDAIQGFANEDGVPVHSIVEILVALVKTKYDCYYDHDYVKRSKDMGNLDAVAQRLAERPGLTPGDADALLNYSIRRFPNCLPLVAVIEAKELGSDDVLQRVSDEIPLGALRDRLLSKRGIPNATAMMADPRDHPPLAQLRELIAARTETKRLVRLVKGVKDNEIRFAAIAMMTGSIQNEADAIAVSNLASRYDLSRVQRVWCLELAARAGAPCEALANYLAHVVSHAPHALAGLGRAGRPTVSEARRFGESYGQRETSGYYFKEILTSGIPLSAALSLFDPRVFSRRREIERLREPLGEVIAGLLGAPANEKKEALSDLTGAASLLGGNASLRTLMRGWLREAESTPSVFVKVMGAFATDDASHTAQMRDDIEEFLSGEMSNEDMDTILRYANRHLKRRDLARYVDIAQRKELGSTSVIQEVSDNLPTLAKGFDLSLLDASDLLDL